MSVSIAQTRPPTPPLLSFNVCSEHPRTNHPCILKVWLEGSEAGDVLSRHGRTQGLHRALSSLGVGNSANHSCFSSISMDALGTSNLVQSQPLGDRPVEVKKHREYLLHITAQGLSCLGEAGSYPAGVLCRRSALLLDSSEGSFSFHMFTACSRHTWHTMCTQICLSTC